MENFILLNGNKFCFLDMICKFYKDENFEINILQYLKYNKY